MPGKGNSFSRIQRKTHFGELRKDSISGSCPVVSNQNIFIIITPNSLNFQSLLTGYASFLFLPYSHLQRPYICSWADLTHLPCLSVITMHPSTLGFQLTASLQFLHCLRLGTNTSLPAPEWGTHLKRNQALLVMQGRRKPINNIKEFHIWPLFQQLSLL